MAAPVLLYTKSRLPALRRARARRWRRAAPSCDEIDVGVRREAIPELLKLTRGRRVVPVVVDGGRILVAPDGGSSF